ncbi:MAG: ABC transporter permease subunit [Planctomycetia bacterium]|nr:ABC transporter permease subunit [Planctomycetia bacterium]
MPQPFYRRIWGEAAALVDHSRRLRWVDLLFVVGLTGLVFGLMSVAREWTGLHRTAVEIDLSPWALPGYTLYSLTRGILAYGISLAFTLTYGYWAAKDARAERVLVPLLDILQSIPVLGFMPGLILSMVALFPNSNIGLELASVIMIFTGQAWNMTFSYYHSLRSVPLDMREVSTVYRFGWWRRLKWVELPYATMGLVWNSMMSMAGGWFFLTVSEAFRLGDLDFRLPGIGSYMSVAIEKADKTAMAMAVVAMTAMIVLVDQLLWRPVVVWAQKFRIEEGGHQEAMSSWFLNFLKRSQLLTWLGALLRRLRDAAERPRHTEVAFPAVQRTQTRGSARLSLLLLGLLMGLLVFGSWKLLVLMAGVTLRQWGGLLLAAFCTLGRVLASTALGTLWALPAGLAIGLSPRISRILQPVIQVVASFPAPMLFPLVIAGLDLIGVSLGFGSILLMLLGTQWYILFNVIAGAMAIPADLKEAARSYRLTGWRRFRILLLPAVFPFLVTGWVTAAGGAWNASIVAEYVIYKGQKYQTIGLGAEINQAAAGGKSQYPLLAASVLVMSLLVVVFNRTVWRRCYNLAEERFTLNK